MFAAVKPGGRNSRPWSTELGVRRSQAMKAIAPSTPASIEEIAVAATSTTGSPTAPK